MRNPLGNYEPLGFFLSAALIAVVYFSTKPAPSTLTIDGQPLAFNLSIGWNESPQSGELTAWLEWRTRLTPLIGREIEQRELREWADAAHHLSFKVIQADGGVGKTRLAAELAQSLLDTKRWTGGFVSLATFERAQRLAWQGNTIVVVDYPEHSPERLAQLMAAAKEGLNTDNKKNKLRILLLCRSSEGINDLLNKQGAQSYVSKAMPLGELAGKGNLNLLNQSLGKLEPKAPSVSQDEFQAWLDQSDLHKTALFVIALALHLSTSPIEANRFLPGAQLLQALLKREQARWEKAEQGHDLPQGVLTDVLAFATLFDGLPLQAINTSLNEAYQWPANTLGKLHSALAEVWPMDKSSQTYPAMAPDLLAAVLLWQWQSAPTKRGVPTDAKLLAGLAPVDQPGVTALLQRWHMQAYDQSVRLQLGVPQDVSALSSLLHTTAVQDADFADQLKQAFQTSSNWTALASLAVATSKPKDEALGLGGNQLAESAMELNNHAVHLASAGDHTGALKAAQEAVDIYKRLAKTNPAAYEPVLAGSINNLADCLSETGDRPGALKAALEAVALYEKANNATPGAFAQQLAIARRVRDGLL